MPLPRHPKYTRLVQALGLCWVSSVSCPAFSGLELSGVKSVVAVTSDGGRLPIGTAQFSSGEGGTAKFRLSLRTEMFTDHFLSMREFKCLSAAKEISCHVPYPYANPATVSRGNYAWLEHSLLFLHKSPAEFGAKLWNGVYYEFREEGTALVGTPKAVDLNDISAPPDDPAVPPFGPAQRHDMPADARWIRKLVIE